MKYDPYIAWLLDFAAWIIAILVAIAVLSFITGCKTSTNTQLSGNSRQLPPLPPGIQKPLAVSRAAPAIVGPPKPVIMAFDVPQTFSDIQGTNLWHPLLYVQTSTNLIDWQTVRMVPLGETPTTVYLTNSSPFGAVRTGF